MPLIEAFIIIAMIRKSGAWRLVLAAGLLIAAAALFADQLGFDRNAGWGRLRMGALIFGIASAAGALLYQFNRARIQAFTLRALSPITDQAWVARLRRSEGFTSASAFVEKYRSTLPSIAFVMLVYIWLVSSGTWTTWISPTQHYADLARGFEKGVLYLPVKPDPRLFELSNPYDPDARTNDMGIDVTFYNGRLYLYWGPVPALILVAISPFTHGRVGDLQLVFAFVSGIFLLQTLLMVMIWDRFFAQLPAMWLQLAILAGGLRTPLTFILNNFISARIYEAAITGGQFFLFAGLVVALTVLGRSPISNGRLAGAGILWALAIGTRTLLVVPIAMLMLVIAAWILTGVDRPLDRIKNLAALGLPVALGLAALGWYNWARFGSVTETGYFYQLAGVNLQLHYRELFSPVYVVQNLYNYLFTPVGLAPQFPYLVPQAGKVQSIVDAISLPAIYNSQIVSGLACTFPLAVFAAIPPAAWLSVYLSRKRGSPNRAAAESAQLNWIVAGLSASTIAGFGMLLVFFWVALRYLEDFMPSLVVLSMIGLWQGYRLLDRHRPARRVYAVVSVALAGAAILVSTLLAISVNDLRLGLLAP